MASFSPRISLGGLASGMDTEAIVSQLMALERQPRVRMELRQTVVQAREDALEEIRTKLSSLKTAAADLRSVLTWADTQTVESSDATKIAARRLAGAGPGGHTVSVANVASAAQRTFTFTQQAAASTITIGSASVALGENATLAEAVSAINASADAGVYAVDVGGRLVLSARTTGVASDFTASGAALTEDAAAARAGADASFTVDGVARTSATNVVTDAIAGVELTLKAKTGTDVTISVGDPKPDTEGVKAKVKAFVDAYNIANDLIRAKVNEKVVPNPTSTADAKKGVLSGDSTLRGLLTSLRSTVGAPVAGNPAQYDELADLGITTGAASGEGTYSAAGVAGTLVIDDAKLDAALNADPQAVQQLLGAVNGISGFAQSFEGLLEPQTQAGGLLDERIKAATTEVTRFKESLTRFDERLVSKEQRLRAQFVALEQALQRSQSVQADLAARLT